MLHGDISNQVGYTFAFRCEDSLLKVKDNNLLDFALNKLHGNLTRAEYNDIYLKAMHYLYRNTEYSVDLVIHEDNYTPVLKKRFESLPFNRIITIRNESSIITRLKTGDISVYIDDNPYRLSLINSDFAIPISDLGKILRGGFKNK